VHRSTDYFSVFSPTSSLHREISSIHCLLHPYRNSAIVLPDCRSAPFVIPLNIKSCFDINHKQTASPKSDRTSIAYALAQDPETARMDGSLDHNGHATGTATEYIQPRPRRPQGRSPLVNTENADGLAPPSIGGSGTSRYGHYVKL
jgi:hypothetical protein